MPRFLLPLAAVAMAAPALAADNAPFDLVGPTLRVSIRHDGETRPIAEVPQLAPGDRIDVRADLPEDQSAHYLLIAAFLRGATNPPPDKWFTQSETWTKKGRKGLSLTVPEGAQQIVLFLAPETGGDFPTLRNAVRGKPGAFVRAAQDLAQASLDRRRLDTFLAAVRRPVSGDPDRLERITPLLARSLQVKINADCLARAPELQAACLLQNQDALVLNDGHTNAITDALAGPGVNLALNISATPQGGLGQYSPYIAAVRDIVGLFSTINTAKYQYIPALAMPEGDRMRLILNAPPSFHNPKSVLVTALPIVAPVRVPPLEIVDPRATVCPGAAEVVLPVSGAPLVYSTHYAHDLALRVALPGGQSVDLPATPDVERGGLVVQAQGKLPAGADAPLDGTIHGIWGFQPFEGPRVRLQPARPGRWNATTGGTTLTLSGGSSACVAGVTSAGRTLVWKANGAGSIEVTPPPGAGKAAYAVEVAGVGGRPPERVEIAGPSQAPRIAASVIARHVARPASPAPVTLALMSDTQVASDATLRVSLRAAQGQRFTGQEKVEVVAETGGEPATLTFADRLTLADAQVMLLTIQPARALGASAFGPLRARIVRDNVAGEWIPLGTLVRLPAIRQITCPPDAKAACELSGDNLFLIESVSPTPGFESPVAIPEGYPGNAIQVPHPLDGTLYVRLRDDPAVGTRLMSNAGG